MSKRILFLLIILFSISCVKYSVILFKNFNDLKISNIANTEYDAKLIYDDKLGLKVLEFNQGDISYYSELLKTDKSINSIKISFKYYSEKLNDNCFIRLRLYDNNGNSIMKSINSSDLNIFNTKEVNFNNIGAFKYSFMFEIYNLYAKFYLKEIKIEGK